MRHKTELGMRLEFVSYGRGGAGRQVRLNASQREQIARIVDRTPEVVVKVTGGGRSVKQVKDEVGYFGRDGELSVETDDGIALRGEGIQKFITDDWDLDLEEFRGRRWVDGKPGRKEPKLVFNLTFSMPAGTASEKVLAAVRRFAQEKFLFKHRYAMVLHTDQPSPHVHMLVKARGEDGERLHLSKPVLREWRYDFAKYLRDFGVAANATDRLLRGVTTARIKTGIYRASLRGESTYVRKRVEGVIAELQKGSIVEAGKARLLEARKKVDFGWRAISKALAQDGYHVLAERVRRFAGDMPPPKTEKEQIAEQLRQIARARTVEHTSTL